MFFSRKTTLIDRVCTFLKGKITKNPRNDKQVKRDWQFTSVNEKINVYGEKRQPLGDMNHLAEITSPNNATILIRYTSNITPPDLSMLTETLKFWAQNKIVNSEPMVKADIDKLTQ
jgi:hypothetical protein